MINLTLLHLNTRPNCFLTPKKSNLLREHFPKEMFHSNRYRSYRSSTLQFVTIQANLQKLSKTTSCVNPYNPKSKISESRGKHTSCFRRTLNTGVVRSRLQKAFVFVPKALVTTNAHQSSTKSASSTLQSQPSTKDVLSVKTLLTIFIQSRATILVFTLISVCHRKSALI